MDIMGPIAAVGSAIGNFIAGKSNNDDISWENAKNRQYDWTKFQTSIGYQDKWRKEDKDWNSYANQRRLLADAGYNPNALFNSASMLSTSNGSASAPSGGAPSVGYPSPSRFQLDPGLINVMADAKLKDKQADNIEVDTEKKKSETKGQNLQNTYQETVNKYQDANIDLDMNERDSRRALNDAQRLAVHTQQMLDFDELYNMRPKEAAKVVAETVVAYANASLADVQSAKTAFDKELAAKRFILETSVASATISNLYAQASFTRTQDDLWQPNGVLYETALTEKKRKQLEYGAREKYITECYDSWLSSAKSSLVASGMSNDEVSRLLSGKNWFSRFRRSVLQGLAVLPGSSTGSLLTPTSLPSLPVPF